MFSPGLKFPITFLSLMLYVFANQAAFSVLSNFTTIPWRIPADQRAPCHVSLPVLLSSIFLTKQIEKNFGIVEHPCQMKGNSDSRSEWHRAS